MNETSEHCKKGPIPDELLHELFEAMVDGHPEHIAVECGPSKLTYRQLEESANRLARRLRSMGVKREDRVGFLLPRSERVYLAMLGILKAGAAYVPLDPETPLDRIRFILKDADTKCLITLAGLADNLADDIPLIRLDIDAFSIASQSSLRITRSDTDVTPENLCYVIYTSGTTGQPKGVPIEHRNVTHLIRAESGLYGIELRDRIFQLASPAFDASIEEIWMAFFHGATLVVGTTDIIRSGPDFSMILERLRVTVLSCVPTFLSMLDRDIPTVRLLILGGEVCPNGLADRWQRPGRILLNTYGPTETTVIATAARLLPGHPVTIGRPIVDYKIFLLDENGQPVPDGSAGEICIGGPGVARGYLNRPELQKKKFIVLETLTDSSQRLYRTGDQARWTPEGDLEYIGRLDDQVKLRGFRIELSEIEAALTKLPEVIAAAADVHRPTQQIAAYVVLRPGYRIDRSALRQQLLQKLPPYMVPAFLDELPSLPMTVSGKIDRQQLPPPQTPMLEERRRNTRMEECTEAERTVLEIWQAVLQRENISLRDNFFLDLGGHSLLAAAAVSKLRQKPGFERLSVADFYTRPTAGALARLIGEGVSSEKIEQPFFRVSKLTYRFCVLGQALGVVLISGIYAWQWLGAYLIYGYLAVEDWPVDRALWVAFCVLCGITPATLILSILLKWLMLGRIRAGQYPLWGWFYWRFWFVRSVVRAAPVHYLEGTPFLNLYYRLMGARIGRNVFIGSYGLATFDLLTVGEGSSIGLNTSIDGASVADGLLTLAPITIGRHCWIGNRCTLGSDIVMEDGSGLDDLSMLPDEAYIPSGELWRGSPAESAGRFEAESVRASWTAASWFMLALGIFLFPLIIVAAVLPGLMAITHIGHLSEGYSFLLTAPLVSLSFVFLLCIELWVFKWLLIGRLMPGRYPVGGFFYARKWFFDQLMTMSTDVTEALYETLYAAPWLRALGARIGARCEIAAIDLVHPDLLEMDSECMIADLAMLGAARVRSGWLSLSRVRLGSRVFIGNSAVVPAGSILEDNVLIGLMSLPPRPEEGPVPKNTSWFGSPPIALPMRYHSHQFSELQTYRPPKRLVALRLFIELFRIFLPPTIFVVLASLIVDTTDVLQDYIHLREWLLTLPFLYVTAGVAGVLITVLIKWLMVGRYQEGERPLWSAFVWRNDLVNGVYSNFCEHFFLGILRGTPFIVWALRAFGMKIGRRCYIDTTWYTEFDLIEIGDDVALNDNANIQTHLFEDRVIKMGRVRIGNRCVVGAMATALYSTCIEDGACLEDLSLLMKGETLGAGTRSRGIPARRSSN